MIGSLFGKVVWLGRATTFCIGLAVVLAVVFGVSTMALAAVPGDPFRLGRFNTIDQLTSLTGSVDRALLKVDNNGDGTALALQTNLNKPPLTVNAGAGKATNLDADQLDGKDASAFVSDDFNFRSAGTEVDSSLMKSVPVFCEQGQIATGGGASIQAPADAPVALRVDRPRGNYGWEAYATEVAPYEGDWRLVVHVICVPSQQAGIIRPE